MSNNVTKTKLLNFLKKLYPKVTWNVILRTIESNEKTYQSLYVYTNYKWIFSMKTNTEFSTKRKDALVENLPYFLVRYGGYKIACKMRKKESKCIDSVKT